MAIVQAPGGTGDFTRNLLNFLISEKRLELAKEEQKLQKDRFKLQQEQFQTQQEIQQAQQAAGAGLLANLVRQDPEAAQTVMGAFPRTRTPQNVPVPSPLGEGTIEQPIVPTRPDVSQLDPATAATLAQGLQEQQATQSRMRLAEAQARGAESAARVSEATEGAVIEATKLDPEIRKAQLEGVRLANEETKVTTRGQQLTNVYKRMMNERDPQRVNQARLLFETGAVTWGQARSAVGLPEDDLIPDNTVFVAPGTTQQNAEALKNLGFAQMMQVSDGIINELSDQGVRLSFLPSLQRQSQSATFDALVNLVSGTDQERLVNAQRMFGDAYRFSLSGQQSSDREALRMLNAIAEQVGDSPETIAQKRALRQVMINVTRAKAGGGMDPVQAARMGLRAAQNTGNEETIEVFENILEETIANQNGAIPSNSPTDPANVGERLERLEGLIDLGISGRPEGPGGR